MPLTKVTKYVFSDGESSWSFGTSITKEIADGTTFVRIDPYDWCVCRFLAGCKLKDFEQANKRKKPTMGSSPGYIALNDLRYKHIEDEREPEENEFLNAGAGNDSVKVKKPSPRSKFAPKKYQTKADRAVTISVDAVIVDGETKHPCFEMTVLAPTRDNSAFWLLLNDEMLTGVFGYIKACGVTLEEHRRTYSKLEPGEKYHQKCREKKRRRVSHTTRTDILDGDALADSYVDDSPVGDDMMGGFV